MIDEKILEEDWKDAKELSKRMSEEYRLSMPSHHDLEHKFQKKFNKK